MTVATLAALLTLVAVGAEAALPGPPFDLTLSSTTLVEGQPVTVEVRAVPGADDGERHDVYLLLASIEDAAFLTPAGAWAPRPVPWATSVSTADLPIVRRWPRAWPPGSYALGMVVVPPSVDPLDRSEWRYRPAVTWIEIAPLRPGDAPPAAGTLAVLGLATAAAVALVWRASIRRGS